MAYPGTKTDNRVNLGGFTMVRNGNTLDFCWRECIRSMLPICDVVSVSVANGEDDTEEEMREWVDREPRLILNIYPWPEPKGDKDFFVDWIQYARQHTPSKWVIQLDADEVLHENSHKEVLEFVSKPYKKSGVVTRYNFWKDHKHLIPEGECCGKEVIRIAPQNVWLPSDGPHPKGHECSDMRVRTEIQIMHYGFIRKPEAFFKKERLLQGYFFDTYDQRLEKAESHEGNWMEMEGVTGWEDKLDKFTGTHPQEARAWLCAHGYVD